MAFVIFTGGCSTTVGQLRKNLIKNKTEQQQQNKKIRNKNKNKDNNKIKQTKQNEQTQR